MDGKVGVPRDERIGHVAHQVEHLVSMNERSDAVEEVEPVVDVVCPDKI